MRVSKFAAIAGLLTCCKQNKTVADASSRRTQIMAVYGLEEDSRYNQLLTEAFKGINCVAAPVLHKRLVLSDSLAMVDTTTILVIPFGVKLRDMKSSAYSDIKNRFILLGPGLVNRFVKRTALNDSSSTPAIIMLLLLHELGHFAVGKEGAFDRLESSEEDESTDEKKSELGEQKMDTEPEYLTSLKRIELACDSSAMAMIKPHLLNVKEMDCYNTAFNVQLVLPGMGFKLFGTRMIGQFGSTAINLLRDPSNTHPNMELRIAFMNYFLSGREDQRKMIDDYLYDREVAPVHRQEMDPRIFQGERKGGK